ncbi:internal virion protein B [Vibrio phage 4141]|nr:internal virion protein [Vibrio phage N4]ACR16502.1 internal virion protein B [Vibrio phage N4]
MKMCDPVSGTLAALGAASGMMDYRNQNKAWAAAETARRKQNIEMVRQANLQDANLMIQDASNFEAIREEMNNATLDNIKAQGAVKLAISESNLEGRTTERVLRDVENVGLKTKGMLNDAYQRDYANIYAQRESVRNNLIGALSGSMAAPRPNAGDLFGSVLGGASQGYQIGSNLNSILESTPDTKLFGVETNRTTK